MITIGLFVLHYCLNQLFDKLDETLYFKKPQNTLWLFLSYHFVLIIILLSIDYFLLQKQMILPDECLKYLFIGLFLLRPSSIIVEKIMHILNLEPVEKEKNKPFELNQGVMIGYLERIIIVVLGLLNQLGVISILLVAKTLVRYGQFQLEKNPDVENLTPNKYLIGTLLSILLGLISVLIIKKASL